MPHVLLLCEYPTLHGGERSMLATLDAVRLAGFSVTVAAPPDGPLAEVLRKHDVELLPFVCHDARGKRLSQDRLREQLANLIGNRDPDLLHANSLAMGRLAGPVAAKLHLPSIAHLRDIVGLSRQAIADLNRNTRLLAVSRATRQFHVARGLSNEKTRVLYNGVDLDQFHPQPKSGYLHRELGLPPEAMLVGTIGQISLRKGQDVLARAAAMLAKRLPQLHYLIVGRRYSEKDESRRFEAQLRDTATGPLAGRFHLLGTRNDVDRLLAELTLLVHPARQEPLGRVLLESAASGVPIVATDVGGTGEIFPTPKKGPGLICRNGPEGASHKLNLVPFSARLVLADDANALAGAIAALISNDAMRAQLAAAARRRAEEAFDANRAAAGLVEHYRQVMPT